MGLRCLILVAFTASLCGCVRTYRMEHKTVVTTAVGTDGTASVSREGHGEERAWSGPWVGQPERVRP